MSLLDDLTAWLGENPPESMPFWPDAKTTGGFGLRTLQMLLDAGASPLHLGVDRAGGREFVMPFDGSLFWITAGLPSGSVLSLVPVGLSMEIQVFHTAAGPHMSEVSQRLHKGDRLPVRPSNLGLSLGVHTHTEVLFPLDDSLRTWVHQGATPIVTRGAVVVEYVTAHCREHRLNFDETLSAIHRQVDGWGIREMTDRYAIRDNVPDYRRPEWGRGPTLHIDSQWLLHI